MANVILLKTYHAEDLDRIMSKIKISTRLSESTKPLENDFRCIFRITK